MKEVNIILDNAGVDKDGAPLFVAHLELFPNEPITIASTHADAVNDCVKYREDFIFKNFNAFPDYKWADYEVQPPLGEHSDMYQIKVIKMPNLIDSI